MQIVQNMDVVLRVHDEKQLDDYLEIPGVSNSGYWLRGCRSLLNQEYTEEFGVCPSKWAMYGSR